jgi:hypothetical protein
LGNWPFFVSAAVFLVPVAAWRKHLESWDLFGSTIRRKLSAVASLFDYLGEKNAVRPGRQEMQTAERSSSC